VIARGTFYDGESSDGHPVSVTRDGSQLHVVGEQIARSYDRRQVQVTPPLGRTRRSLLLPDGAVCELAEGPAVGKLLPEEERLGPILHRWERSPRAVLAALAATVFLVWAFLRFGIPVLAEQAAARVPPAAERTMAAETLEVLDRVVLAPSRLPSARQEELRALFAAIREDLPEAAGYRLEVRRSDPLGANALALPGGIVVVTDAFVELARHEEEIVAVLAHEIAHVRRRHALRQVLQNSAGALLIASLTGDFTSLTSLAATLPTALVHARYSRRFETEADDDAVAYLRRRRIPPERFAGVLERLQAAHEERRTPGGERPFGDLFSTHPETRRRVERILSAR
jgi:Zn-dependent protease with chaperone function